jgi:hypothetical protein
MTLRYDNAVQTPGGTGIGTAIGVPYAMNKLNQD